MSSEQRCLQSLPEFQVFCVHLDVFCKREVMSSVLITRASAVSKLQELRESVYSFHYVGN